MFKKLAIEIAREVEEKIDYEKQVGSYDDETITVIFEYDCEGENLNLLFSEKSEYLREGIPIAYSGNSLQFFSVEFEKHYIAFSKDGTRVCSIKFRKKRISIEFVRGNIKHDGSKTKGFFTFDDPKKRAKVIEQKYVDGRRFNYELFLSNSDELDYIMFLVEQKFNTL